MKGCFTQSKRNNFSSLFTIPVSVIFLVGFLYSAKTNAQIGVVPLTTPVNGFAIDGYLQRQSTASDWLKGTNPAFQAPGTYLFNDDGSPAVGGLIFHLTDPYNSQQDDIFSGS